MKTLLLIAAAAASLTAFAAHLPSHTLKDSNGVKVQTFTDAALGRYYIRKTNETCGPSTSAETIRGLNNLPICSTRGVIKATSNTCPPYSTSQTPDARGYCYAG